MERYEELVKKIQELVPEIMELKLGCRVRIGRPVGEFELDWNEHTVYFIHEKAGNKLVPHSLTTCCGIYIPTSAADGRWQEDSKFGGWDNVGRPIQLPDVLRAMKAEEIRVDEVGRFHMLDEYGDWEDKGVFWDLTQPLSGQKPEVWEFLAGVLLN